MSNGTINKQRLHKTLISYLILISAIILLFGGLIFVAKEASGVKKVSLINIEFEK